MLLCTKTHFIKSLEAVLDGEEGDGTEEERRALGQSMLERMKLYATDETAKAPGAGVWFWSASEPAKAEDTREESGVFRQLIQGSGPKIGQRVVYVDGGFDLFSSGHIEFLRKVAQAEEKLARADGWYSEQAVNERVGKGSDYPPAYVVVGVHEDQVINRWKGVNYPIMNIFERGLCVLQCKVSCPSLLLPPQSFAVIRRLVVVWLLTVSKFIHGVVFGAPFTPTDAYLTSLPLGRPDAIYHGPTSFMPLTFDPYAAPKLLGIYKEIGDHAFSNVNAGEIVQRIMKSRDLYEARQRAKGMKAGVEAAARQREILEEEQRKREEEMEMSK